MAAHRAAARKNGRKPFRKITGVTRLRRAFSDAPLADDRVGILKLVGLPLVGSPEQRRHALTLTGEGNHVHDYNLVLLGFHTELT